jgi:hypothetical protein
MHQAIVIAMITIIIILGLRLHGGWRLIVAGIPDRGGVHSVTHSIRCKIRGHLVTHVKIS